MPTGYTADITKGQTFESFVLTCARAFGALIHMRDEPLSADVPDKVEPAPYYKDACERARKALDDFEAHPSKHRAQWADSNQARVDSYHRRLSEAQAQREAYTRMRARAQAWSPPSPDHAELKSFMLRQIETSMESDCWMDQPPELPDFATWVEQRHASLVADVRRAEKAYAEERQRADDRTRWIRQLKESLR